MRAAASPAGPPPAITTSYGIGASLCDKARLGSVSLLRALADPVSEHNLDRRVTARTSQARWLQTSTLPAADLGHDGKVRNDMKSDLEKFYAAVKEIDTAMMTTRRADGHLRSRAMANQKQADGADLWFVTADGLYAPRLEHLVSQRR